MQLVSSISHTRTNLNFYKSICPGGGALPQSPQQQPQHQLVPECACKQQTQELQQRLARNVRAYARQHKGDGRRTGSNRPSHPGSSRAPAQQQQQHATADAAGLLQALIQLASRTTIMLGSHQAYAILESLEGQLPQQLHSIPLDLLASGAWAMARLQLQPQQQLIAAIAQHLLQQQQQQQPGGNSAGVMANSNSSSNSALKFTATASSTRLASCSTRSFGTFCYTLNYFLLRDAGFWATAAAVSLQHLGHKQFKPNHISNLLQGIALSGWVLNPGDLGPQQVSSSRLGLNTAVPADAPQQTAFPQQHQQLQRVDEDLVRDDAAAAPATTGLLAQGTNSSTSSSSTTATRKSSIAAANAGGAAAVLALLRGVESSILAAPWKLCAWRMRDISQAAQAYSLVGYRCGPLFAVLAQHMLEQSPLLYEKLSRSSSRSSIHPQQQQQQRGNVLTAAFPNSSSSTQSPGPTFGSSGPDWHDKGRGPARLVNCRAGDAVGLAWAYVHSFCANQLLLYELAGVLTVRADQLHAADVGRLLWAYATADVVDDRMLAAVTAAVCEEMHCVLPRTAAGAVWALGMMQHEAPAFLEAAFDRLAACLEATGGAWQQQQQQPQAATAGGGQRSTPAVGAPSMQLRGHLSSSAAAAAGAGAGAGVGERPSVLQQLYQGGTSAAGWLSGGPEVRGYETPAQGELTLMPSLLQPDQPAPVQQAVVQVSARDVSEAVWAAGRLLHFNASFFRALRPRFQALLPQFSDVQLVDVLWGLARLQLYDEANMDAAAEEVIRRAPGLSARMLGLTAWAFAALRHGHPRLFGAISGRVMQLVADGLFVRPVDARQLVYAAAKLGVRDEALMRACAQVLKARMRTQTISLCVSSMWSFAVAGHYDEELFAGCVSFLRSFPLKYLRPLHLLQIFQATTLVKDGLGPAAESLSLQLPPQLATAVQKHWLTTTRRSPRSRRTSTFADDVAGVLRHQLGLKVRREQRTADGLFSIDLALTWKDRQVAVEVDGPDHFTRNTPHTLLGSTTAKHSCLQTRGWAVLSVAFYDWSNITAQFAAAPGTASCYPQQQLGGQGVTHVQPTPDWLQQQAAVGLHAVQAATAPAGDTDADAAGANVNVSAAAAAAEGGGGAGGGGPVPADVAAAAEAAAVAAGVPPSQALLLAAARAAFLTAALDRAVESAGYPRGLSPPDVTALSEGV